MFKFNIFDKVSMDFCLVNVFNCFKLFRYLVVFVLVMGNLFFLYK